MTLDVGMKNLGERKKKPSTQGYTFVAKMKTDILENKMSTLTVLSGKDVDGGVQTAAAPALSS